MAQKFLNIIRQFSVNDLREFLRKNGYEDFEETLISAGIDNGAKFLELDEPDLVTFGVSLVKRKKFLIFVAQIKENPQNYLTETEIYGSLKRSPSLRMHGSFRENREWLISVPKTVPEELKKSEPSSPIKDHYDDSGYLLFAEPHKCGTKEKNYYDVPKSVLKEKTHETILTLTLDNTSCEVPPREESPPPLSSGVSTHLDNKGNNVTSKSKADDSPLLLFENEDDSDTEYRPSDESRSSSSEKITDVQSASSDTGTISRFLGLFRRKKSDTENEQYKLPGSLDRNKSKRSISSPSLSRSLELSWSPTTRPLPVLPYRLSISREEELKHQRVFSFPDNETFKKDTNTSSDAVTNQSKSKNNLITRNQPGSRANFWNLTNEEPKWKSRTPKINKRPLPLPPATMPELHFAFDDTNNHFSDSPFYRNTDRKGAHLVLFGREDGAFLFRPSNQFFLALSLRHNSQYFSLGIEKTPDNKIRLDTEIGYESPEFSSLDEFVEYFTRNFVTFPYEGQIIKCMLKPILPSNAF